LTRSRGQQELNGVARSQAANQRDALGRSLLAAFPDRVACRRTDQPERAQMVGGRGLVLIDRGVSLTSPLFLALDIDAGIRGQQADAVVKLLVSLDRGWLESRTVVEEEVRFDAEHERVVAALVTRYQDLVLEERPVSRVDSSRAALMLAQAAEREPRHALGLEQPDTSRFLTRLALLREWIPELEIPAMDEAALVSLLPSLCAGKRSFEELRQAPLAQVIGGLLSREQRRALDEEVPDRIEVPSGSHLQLTYEMGQRPVLAVRIQEIFGWTQTPRLARGRIPVSLHLLAPSGRPQQVTDDLASFWATTYHEVRRELRGRYPKHAWPEDPLTALPERRPRRKR
jgi:ATP-dependent helicase HrpB